MSDSEQLRLAKLTYAEHKFGIDDEIVMLASWAVQDDRPIDSCELIDPWIDGTGEFTEWGELYADTGLVPTDQILWMADTWIEALREHDACYYASVISRIEALKEEER